MNEQVFIPDRDGGLVPLMLRVSRMYYERGRTQAEIARATRVSRPTVSRLLERARRTGIVTIRIQDPSNTGRALADTLAERFDLTHVVLADPATSPGLEPRACVGKAAADYLPSVLRDGMTVGVTWGQTLREMALRLRPAHLANLTVVQMVGGLAVLEDTLDTTGLAKEVGRLLGARTVQFLAPAFVDDPDVRRTILSTPPVRQARDFLRRLDVAVVGIGAVSAHVPLVERGYLSARAMARCRRLGARGELLLQFYDAGGRPIPALNESLIGLGLDDLPRVPRVIAVVSGPPDKTEAVLGALRGRLVDVLVTDLDTARRVLRAADDAAALSDRKPTAPSRERLAADGRGPRRRPIP